MARVTITNLPSNHALDYKAMSAIRGSGAGDWVLFAFLPYTSPVAAVPPIFNFYQTNYVANNLTVQTENINLDNSAPSASINVGATQNALTVNVAPSLQLPHP